MSMSLVTVNSLEQVREILEQSRQGDNDFKIHPKDISEVKIDRIVTPQGDFALTDTSAGQLAYRAGIPANVFNWLRKNQADHAQEILSERWDGYLKSVADGNKNSEMLVRGRVIGGENGPVQVCRAVLTDRYGIIDGVDLVDRLITGLPETLSQGAITGMKKQFWFDPMTGQISLKGILHDPLPGTEKDKHNWGFGINNDECGGGASAFDLLFGRLFCTNQFAAAGVGRNRQSHVVGKIGLAGFQERVNTWLREQTHGAQAKFAKYWELKELRVSDPAEVLMRMGRLQGLNKGDLEKVVANTLPRYLDHDGPTGFAVVNALTEFARDLEDREKQVLWERASGLIVTEKSLRTLALVGAEN